MFYWVENFDFENYYYMGGTKHHPDGSTTSYETIYRKDTGEVVDSREFYKGPPKFNPNGPIPFYTQYKDDNREKAIWMRARNKLARKALAKAGRDSNMPDDLSPNYKLKVREKERKALGLE